MILSEEKMFAFQISIPVVVVVFVYVIEQF